MLEFFIAAAVFGLSGGLSPGPLLTLVVAETLARGRNAGLAVAMSPLITDGPAIAAAVLLLGRIENSDPALGIISIAGGSLLTAYGIAGLRGSDVEVEEAKADRGVWASLGKGVSVNFLNPNPYLFWLTIGTPILLRAHESSSVRNACWCSWSHAPAAFSAVAPTRSSTESSRCFSWASP